MALLFILATPQSHAERSLTCHTLPKIFRAYFSHHSKEKSLTPEIKKRIAETFLKKIDPSKTLFLESEAAELKNKIRKSIAAVERGNCKYFASIRDDVIARTALVEAYIRKVVEKPKTFKLDEKVELVLNPDKRGFPQTVSAKNELNRKLIHFQMSNYLSAGTSMKEARKQLVHRYELRTKRAKELLIDDYYDIFMDSFAYSLDPHSSYLSSDVLEDFQINMSLSLEGIGVSLSSRDGYTVIEDIIPGGAADKIQGEKRLKPKDKIIAVSESTLDGKAKNVPVNITDMSLRDVVRLIRGKKNTAVQLTILRKSEPPKRLIVTIVRDKINLEEQAAKLRYEEKTVDGKKVKLAVIDLPSFYGDSDPGKRSALRDVRRLLIQAKKKGVDGVLLDLSRNGGGLLTHAVSISGLFLKTGNIVAVKDSRNRTEKLDDTDETIDYSGPLVVLTSRLSASASEILAGAVKDYRRAIIVGDDHTFGKGTVQTVISLPPGLGALKVTTGTFFRPGGHSTQHRGVASDIVIPSIFNTDEIGEKSYKHSIQPDKIDRFLSQKVNSKLPEFQWEPVTDQVISQLAKRSEERVKKNDEFKEILKKLEENKKKDDKVKLAELRKETEKAKAEEEKEEKAKKNAKKNDKKKNSVAKKEKEDTPQLKEALNILADYVSMNRKQLAKK